MKHLSRLFILMIVCTKLNAQSDYITLGNRQYDVLDRLEIKLRKDSVLNFSAVKPFDRKQITQRLQYIQELSWQNKISLSKVDKYNLDLLLKDNFEWRKDFGDSSLSLKKCFSKTIKTNPAYWGIKSGDLSIYVTPLFELAVGKDDNVSDKLFTNTRGFYVRGTITKGLGFYSYYRTAQERDPLYVQQFVNKRNAVPGEGYFKTYNVNGYDYFDARGGIMFKVAKGIDMQFAYDKVFIGNGFRSLILSDFSNNFLFWKTNIRLWKFQYYNLLAQTISTFPPGPDGLRPQKYMAMHYLDFQVAKWMNIGFFENVMFGRSAGFDLNYLNPVIFYRSVEQQVGSPDKVTLGFNIKANPFKNTQLYSQIVINEFVMDEILHYKRGNYRNKHALQLGFKTIDLFGIKNLDLQGEMNLIRPFTYTHYDTVGSFTHYNQPLAHPLGASVREFIGVLKYQPFKKLNILAKVIYNEQGLDSAGKNMGGNIFNLYNVNRPRDNGFFIGTGILAKTFLSSFTATYELIPNIFIDANATIRKYKKADVATEFNSNMYSVGIRMNLQRRQFDF
jgi:hypothetical protein